MGRLAPWFAVTMAAGCVHVVGAGLAGLSAATSLSNQGYRVQVYESAAQAGGRCRSFHDEQLGCVIDNGNHLILSGNKSTQEYIGRIGAQDRLLTSERPQFPFVDAGTRERWMLDLGRGMGGWRVLLQRTGIPDVRRLDLLGALRLGFSPADASVQQQVGGAGDIYRRLWEPLCLAVLNTEPEHAMARSLWPVLRETLGVGPDACRPVFAKTGLSHALVEPALGYLREAGAPVHFNATLKTIGVDRGRVTTLGFSDHAVDIPAGDRVILCLPIAGVNAVLPAIETPDAHRPIVNAHFLLPSKSDEITFIGLINGEAHWVFRKGQIASVTVSAATSLVDATSQEIASRLWPDVTMGLQMPDAAMGAYRVIKEKRATFAQTPDQNRRRPGGATAFENLTLAGDWTATGLPATIEGAIRSGQMAAEGVG